MPPGNKKRRQTSKNRILPEHILTKEALQILRQELSQEMRKVLREHDALIMYEWIPEDETLSAIKIPRRDLHQLRKDGMISFLQVSGQDGGKTYYRYHEVLLRISPAKNQVFLLPNHGQ